jgi:AcrR family transcriptional regulator
VGRWAEDANGRLRAAAMQLYVERGFEDTTVADIAAKAGVTARTFFRHFADKREVLFGGQDALNHLFGDAITGAPGSATPIDAVGAALDAAATIFSPERRTWVQQRQAVIAGNSDLRERELLKGAALTAVMADALRKRGVTDPAASLAAELGSLAFRNAYARWTDPAIQRDFADIARQELDGLRAATAALD